MTQTQAQIHLTSDISNAGICLKKARTFFEVYTKPFMFSKGPLLTWVQRYTGQSFGSAH